jgi:hypothetical protein
MRATLAFVSLAFVLSCGGTTNGTGSSSGTGCATPLCGGSCCAAADSCVGNACCPAAQVCGGTCCAATDACISDACCPQAQACGATCCSSGATCKDTAGNLSCATICVSASDCSTGCCAPLEDSSGDLVGPYVCQSDCCADTLASCPGSSCCIEDVNGNEFCAQPCNNSSTCGTATCNAYSFAHSSCPGPDACGPP